MNTPPTPGADGRRDPWRDALNATADCIPLDKLFAADLEPPDRGHLSTCARCQAERALAMAFASDDPAPDEGAAVAWIAGETRRRVFPAASGTEAPRARWLSLPTWTAWTSAALAASLGVYLLVRTPGLPQGEPEPEAVYRTSGVSVIAPVGEVTGVPMVLRWTAAAGAERYEVRVTEVDGTEIWRAATASTVVDLPPVVREAVKPARTLNWDVTARDAAGNGLGGPATASFRLMP